jgi:hypothetical protein
MSDRIGVINNISLVKTYLQCSVVAPIFFLSILGVKKEALLG